MQMQKKINMRTSLASKLMRVLPEIIIGIALLFSFGCSRQPAHDFSTPEGAILCLEDAYRSKDVEAAVQCKEFSMEARLMLAKLMKLKGEIDDDLVKKTAEVLELAYRKEIQQKGFPDMTGVSTRFPKVEPFQEGVVVVTEACTYSNGRKSQQRVLVAKTDKGWRVLNPID